MKKRLMGLILAIIMLCGVPLHSGAASVSDFKDISSGAWYYGAVEYAVSNNLFKGTSGIAFSPDAPMNRGMFVTVLGRMADVPEVYGNNKDSKFDDVKHSDYFYPYASWCNDTGIVKGISEKRFAPNDEISREQMAVLLYRYAEKKYMDTNFTSTKYAGFSDINKVSQYAVDALKWATSHEVINGSGGKINPQGKATRAQVAQILLNFSQFADPSVTPDPTPSPEPSPTPDPEGSENGENYNPVYERLTGKSSTDTDGGYYDYDLANEIMDQINALRAENGLNELAYHPKIQEWACTRAKEHTARNGHKRPDGSHWSTVGKGLSAENLLYGNDFSDYYKSDISSYASEVIDSWFGSVLHKNSMLEPLYKLGAVSCYVRGNEVYIAHLFTIQSKYYMDYRVEQ